MVKFCEYIKKSFSGAIKELRASFGLRPKRPRPTKQSDGVLMFGWELPPFNSGGLGVACFELTRELANFGVPVTFVLPKKEAIKAEHLKLLFADQSPKCEFVETNLVPYKTSLGGEQDEDRRYSRELVREVYRYGQKAKGIAKREKFEVIHAHDWLSFPAGVAAKKVTGKPLVVHVHATEFDRCGGANFDPDVFQIEKDGLRYADRVIAVSEYTKNILVKHYDVAKSKIKVVHNGVKKEKTGGRNLKSAFAPFKAAGRKVVLFLGRVTLQKGPDYFIEAARKVLEVYPKVIFVVCGTGDMENQLIERTASMGIADKIFFTGFIKNEDLSKVYRSADLYVMPSVSEPFGIVALEALTNKTPVIISKQSGVAETVKHALKVDFWNTDELANKIHAVLENPSLKRTLRTHGAVEAESQSWDKAAKKCLSVYRDLIYQ